MSLLQLPSLFAFAALVVCAPAQELREADSAQLTAQIHDYLEAHAAVGLFSGAALVADEGEVIYQGAFGLANDDWELPNSVDTRFRLASVTKQFTAMLVLLLVEEGRLELEAPVTRYLPDYPAESGDRISVHHLLNHTSGLPNYTASREFNERETLFRLPVDQFVAKFCSEPLEFEPGARFSYSNSGYYLLGALVEAVTGQSYATALRERVLEPLGMVNTGYDDQNAVLKRRATGYDEVLGGRRLAQWIDMSNPFSAGALYSTVGDLWKWDQALRSKRLLDGELEEQMFTPGHGGYGYGWFIDRSEPLEPRIWHDGGIPGFATRIERMPTQGRCVILLCNSSSSSPAAATAGIYQLLEGRTPEAPSPRADWALARTVLDEGLEEGLEQLAKLPRSLDRRIEPDLNMLGYQLLWQDRVDEALRLFEFNTRAFPKSSNTWDSLGEAQLQAGDRRRAIDSYRKALELDPDSVSAGPMLERLERLERLEAE